MSSRCGGKCGCGASCKCPSSCGGCPDISMEQSTTTETLGKGVAPQTSHFEASDKGGPGMVQVAPPHRALKISEPALASEMGVVAENVCKCGDNCTCNPCKCGK